MTRIRDLEFPYRSALYRGDGSGVAVVRGAQPFGRGSCWAVVETPGAGLGDGYLYLNTRAGGDVHGTLMLQVFVFAVSGDADDMRPNTWTMHEDPRLDSRGEFTGVEDVAEARRDDIASATKLAADAERMKANTFTIGAVMEGRNWLATISPTFPDGTTDLTFVSDDGERRELQTVADRAVLLQALRSPTEIEVTTLAPPPWVRRKRRHTMKVTLFPLADER